MPERLAAIGLIFALACSSGEADGPRTGSLRVEWTGADTGKLVAPAVLEWCDSLRMLEVRAVRGDSGIAIVVYPLDSVRPGDYPILLPQRADSSRPAAAVALRWFGETSISGFQGDSGTVTLELSAGGTTAGRFIGALRSMPRGRRLAMSGSFSGLAVVPAAQGCVADRGEIAPADTGGGPDDEPPEPDPPPEEESPGNQRS